MCVFVCESVCPHDKTKTAETKIAKLGTQSITIPRPPMNIRSKVKVKVTVTVRLGDRVVGVSYAPISKAPLVTVTSQSKSLSTSLRYL